MRSFIVFLIAVISFFQTVEAQKLSVTGNATLFEETFFEGIEVAWFGQSPTANDTSFFTDDVGNFEGKVSPGIYSVSFSKGGFETLMLSDILVIEPLELENRELFIQTVKLNGKIEGEIKKNRYRVDSVIFVAEGDSVQIEPGTEIYFSEGAKLNMFGSFIASGTENEPILLKRRSSETVPGLFDFEFLGTGQEVLHLSHCDLDFQNFRVVELDSLFLGDCAFLSGNVQLLPFSESFIQSCEFLVRSLYISGGNGLIHFSGNELDDMSVMIDMSAAGAQSGWDFYENTFVDVFFEALPIPNFMFTYNRFFEGYMEFHDESVIDHNTFYGSRLNFFPSALTIVQIELTNSHLTNCEILYLASEPLALGFNLFHENTYVGSSQDSLLDNHPGFSTTIALNDNGDSVDVYSNLFEDPLFASVDPLSPDFFELTGSSPGINAGGTLTEGANGTDLGPIPFEGVITKDEQVIYELEELSLYPNPASVEKGVAISFPNGIEKSASVEVFDMSGQLIRTTTPGQLEQEGRRLSGLSPGLYILQVQHAGRTHSTRLSVTQ